MGKVNTTITLDPRHDLYLQEMDINLSKKVREMLDKEIDGSSEGVEVDSHV
jgi:hypothetical protein